MDSRVRKPPRGPSRSRGTNNRTGALIALAATLLTLVASSFVATSMSVGAPSESARLTAGTPSGPLHATIRRTSHGIPHIVGDSIKNVAFGYGYAFAEDNICVIAREYVKVNGELSRYFGPDGSYSQGGNGASQTNLDSDFFFQRIKDRGTIEALLELPPPRGPRPELKDGVRGFVAGYNKYLRETGVDNLPDPSCRGAEWVGASTSSACWRARESRSRASPAPSRPLAQGRRLPPLLSSRR
jgi:acyl-homoserine-lactone acylase